MRIVVDGIKCRHCKDDIKDVLMTYDCIDDVIFYEEYIDVLMNGFMDEKEIFETIENCGNYNVREVLKEANI